MTQSHCVDDATADCRYRGRRSQSSSDTVAGDSRCSAGIGCCGDGTSRMPERCVGVSWASQIMSMLMLVLLKMLTLRPQRYEPGKPLTLHAPALLTLQQQSRGFCGATARRLEGPDKPAAGRLLGSWLSLIRARSLVAILIYRLWVVGLMRVCVQSGEQGTSDDNASKSDAGRR